MTRTGGVEQRLVHGKQRAISSTRDFTTTRKENVIEYAVTLMLGLKAKALAKENESDPSTGCYQYYFRERLCVSDEILKIFS